MTSIEKNIYCFSTLFKFFGIEVGNRMTVIQLPENKLWVHSPIVPTTDMIKTLSGMGDVAYIISPNAFHHLHLRAFQAQYPKAKTFGVPGLEKKQKGVQFHSLFMEDFKAVWHSEIEMKIIDGMPQLNEVAFFHKASKTLILTDLLFNLQHQQGLSKFLAWMDGIDGRLAFSKLAYLFIKDKQAFQHSVKSLMDWDFERIVMSHGVVVEEDAKEQFLKAFSFVKR